MIIMENFMKIKIVTFSIGILIFLISCASQPSNTDNRNKNNIAEDDHMAVLTSHFQYVISPTVRGNSVVLVSEKYTLIYRPNNNYIIINLQTETGIMGIYEFTIFSQPRIPNELFGKIFLFDSDIIGNMTRRELLSSNFSESAHTILVPIKVTEKEVIYRYEKPNNLQGIEIEFKIIGIIEE